MSEYSPSYRDTIIIPDKYNTGLSINESELTVVTEGGKYGGIQVSADGNLLKLNLKFTNHNKTPGEHLCEGYDFTNFNAMQVLDPGSTDLGVRKFIFKNCVFQSMQMNTDFNAEYTTFEFVNCVFKRTAGARCSSYYNCAFINSDTDCMTGYHDIYVKDSYFANQRPTTNDGGHIDGIQISNGEANNIILDNCRFESLEYYTTHTSYINASIMLQVESNLDSDNIVLKDCIINGGGYSLYTWNKNTGLITNVEIDNVKCGESYGYGMWYPTKTGCSFTDEDVTQLETLYVSSIIKDEANHKYKIITSNDLLSSRTLKIVTNLGTQTFSIEATYKRYEVPETIVSIDDYPVDKDIQIDSQGVDWIACFDSTSGTDVQIRYIEFEHEPIYSAILTATVLPSDCTDEVIWESNDTTIATVTPIANTNTATVTAIKAGSCIITVTCGDYSDSCNVTVGNQSTTGELFVSDFTQGKFTDGIWVPDVEKYAVSKEFRVTPGKIINIECLGNPEDYDTSTQAAFTVLFYNNSHSDISTITNPVIKLFDRGVGPQLWRASFYTSPDENKLIGGGTLVPDECNYARVIAYGYGKITSSITQSINTLAKMVTDGLKWTMTEDDDLTPLGEVSGLIQQAGGISGSGKTEIFKASEGYIYLANTTSSTTIEIGTGADNPPISTTTYDDFNQGTTMTSSYLTTSAISNSDSNYLYVSHPSTKYLYHVWRGIVANDGPIRLTEIDLGDTYYINTGYTPTANTKVVSLLSTHKSNSWSTPFGSSDFFKCIWTNTDKQIRFEYKGKYGLLNNIPTTLTDVTITCDGKGHTFSIDDSSVDVDTTGRTTPLGPILIGTGLSSAGAIETPPVGTYTKIKTFKIYEDDVLVMDFVPATSEGVEGLYDTIGKQFYGKRLIGSEVSSIKVGGQYNKLLLKDIGDNKLSVPFLIAPTNAISLVNKNDITIADTSIASAVINPYIERADGWGSYFITPQQKVGSTTFTISCDGKSDPDIRTIEVVDKTGYDELELISFNKYQSANARYNVHLLNMANSSAYTCSFYKVTPNKTYHLTGSRTTGTSVIAVHALADFDIYTISTSATLLGDASVYSNNTDLSIDTTFTTPTGCEYIAVQWMLNTTFTITEAN